MVTRFDVPYDRKSPATGLGGDESLVGQAPGV